MKVSVVVTVYNLRHLAPSAVASVLAQAPAPHEVIVVDDGSTDGSADALQTAFGDQITLVRLGANRGVLRATLEGLQRVTGDIVSFLDADDAWTADKVRVVTDAFAADSALIFLSHDYTMVDAWGGVLRADDPYLAPTRALAAAGNLGALDAFMRKSVLEYGGHVWLGSAYSIRRGALDVERFEAWVDDLPDASLVYQDHPLATFLFLHDRAGRAGYVDRKLFRYTMHDENYSSAAGDLGRAMRIVRKGLATRRATHALVRAAGPGYAASAEVQAAKIHEYEFLEALYAGSRVTAAREFARCARSVWGPTHTIKELSRFASVTVVGPERFFALKRRGLDVLRRGARLFRRPPDSSAP